MDAYVTGETIKRLREAKGMTQAELARRLDVGDKAVSNGRPERDSRTSLCWNRWRRRWAFRCWNSLRGRRYAIRTNQLI